jgi:hypothetical protein
MAASRVHEQSMRLLMFDGKSESWCMFMCKLFAWLLQLGHTGILSDREGYNPERQRKLRSAWRVDRTSASVYFQLTVYIKPTDAGLYR